MTSPAAIRLLIQSRQYAQALVALDSAGGAWPLADVIRLRRQCLARMGRFAEAASTGARLLADKAAGPDDLLRQAQLYIECGAWAEAMDAAMAGWEAGEDHRLVAPLAQASLAQPELARRLPAGAPLPAAASTSMIFAPQRLPHYAALDADHPGTMGMVRNARNLEFHVPACPQGDWLRGLPAAVEATLPVVEQVRAMHPRIDRGAAARYLGARLVSALPDCGGGALDFLTNVPMTVGQRAFVLWYDVLPTLFQPFQPFDDTHVSAANSPLYWIVRGYLESPYCLSVITHYALENNPLLQLFRSPTIRDKLVYIRPCETEGPSFQSAPKPSGGAERPLRLLFTSSRNFTEEGFYYRGGVDVLNAFLDLVEEGAHIELVLRTPLPETLSERLRKAVHDHPRIRWVPGYLPAEDYEALFASADIFAMPASVLYRNGVAHAMRLGLVPLVSDIAGMEDLVQDGDTGIVVRGRGHMLRIDRDPPGVRQDLLPVLRANDRPCDPKFFAALKEALRAQMADRASLDRLSERARATAAGWSWHRDLDAFESCLGRALAQAQEMRRRSIPLHLPRQVLQHRFG